MDFVNWVLSRVDEVMAQPEGNSGGDRKTQKRTLERFATKETVEIPETLEVQAPRSAA